MTFPDTFGFIGAFVLGLPLSLFLYPKTGGNKYEKIVGIAGLVLSAIILIVYVVAFFAAAKPEHAWYFD